MIQGCVCALVTPMKETGEVDWYSLDRLVDYHLAEQSDGFLLFGSTGEPALLTTDEKQEISLRVMKRVAGRFPIWGGISTNSTQVAVETAKQFESWGFNACMAVVPYYIKPTQEGIYQHFKAIAQSISIPLVLYNVPGRVGVDMALTTIQSLAALPNVQGIKEGTNQVERCMDWMTHLPQDFCFYSGDDAVSLPLILMGAHGCVSVTGNVVPRLMHDMCRAATTANLELARDIHQRLWGLHRYLFIESNPIPVKFVLAEMGLIEKGIRLPLTYLSEQHHEKLRQAMKEAGLNAVEI